MRERYEYRHVVGAPWDGPSRQAETGGWIRLRELRPYDPALVVALTDAWYPAIFTRVREPMGVPTIDLTVHIRSVEALRAMQPEDWMAVRFRTTVASEGFLEEDGELWTPEGTLVAHSRQLGLILGQ
jgi:acyl-CoA thioesterase